jgi:hypothetical protein
MTTDSPSERSGPSPPPRARILAAGAIMLVTALVAAYAVGEHQRAARLAREVERLHEVERVLADSLAAVRARPATAPPR